MNAKRKMPLLQTILIFVLMAAAALTAKHYTPTQYLAESRQSIPIEQLLPRTFNEWQIDDSMAPLVVDPSQLELSDRLYSQVVARTYVNKTGQRVMLVIAYGKDQSDGLQVHTPEACYPVAGFQVSTSHKELIALGDTRQSVVKLVAERAGQKEPITYWVTVGDYVVNTGPKGRRNVRFKYGFNGIIPDGLLFRVSTRGQDVAAQYEDQTRFLRDFRENLDPEVRRWLFGRFTYAEN